MGISLVMVFAMQDGGEEWRQLEGDVGRDSSVGCVCGEGVGGE